MSHVPHEIAEEFPEKADLIHQLKTSDSHFARLMDEYHDVNRQVHRAETKVMPTDEIHEAELRKQRMVLKDEIWKILSA